MESDGQDARRSSAAADHSPFDDSGFVLVALLISVAIASVWMAAALPSWRQQVIREREAELIFRGEQYARAILLYQQQFGSLPNSLDDLVSQHVLRRKWKDPIADDEFLPRVGCQQFPGAGGRGGPAPGGGGRGPGGITPPGGGAPGGGGPGGGGPGGGGGPVIVPGRGGRLSQSGVPEITIVPAMAQAGGRGGVVSPTQGRGPAPQIGGPSAFGGGQIAQGGICGVQSKSKSTSIRIYNGQQQYDLWQFDTATAALQFQRTVARLGGGIQPGVGGMPIGGVGSPITGQGGAPGGRGVPGPGGAPGGRGIPGRPGGPGNIPGRGVGPGGPTFPGGGGQPATPTVPGGRRGF